MSRPLKVTWQDSPETLEQTYRQEHDGKVKMRLYALWQICIGNSVKSVAGAIGYSYNAVVKWLRRYKEGGISGLKDKKGRGRRREITREELSELQDMARRGELATLAKARDIIESRYGVGYSLSGLWRLFKREDFSWKMPRRKHTEGDPEEQEAFKKRGITDQVKEQESELREWAEVKLCFLDELRLGLIPNYRRCWGLKGEPLTAPYGMKYEWSWLWLSVEVSEGNLEALWTPCVGQELTELFLNQLRQAYPDSFLIVVLDQAGWHTVNQIPEGMMLIPLPAYSPELNPVENVNCVLRGEIANRYIEDLLEKERLIEQKLREYWRDPKSLVQLTFHPWIRRQWLKIRKLIHRYNI